MSDARGSSLVGLRATALALAIALPACGNGTKHPDMSAPVPADLSAPGDLADLAAPADLMNACGYADDAFTEAPIETVPCNPGDTNIAGTCAAEFWNHVARCFNPAGCCVGTGPDHDRRNCWASGACSEELLGGLTNTFEQDGKLCGSDDIDDPPNGSTRTWTAGDGRKWHYDVATGDVICPDGTHINAGAGQRYCGYQQRVWTIAGCSYPPPDPTCCTPYPLFP